MCVCSADSIYGGFIKKKCISALILIPLNRLFFLKNRQLLLIQYYVSACFNLKGLIRFTYIFLYTCVIIQCISTRG